MIRQKNKELIPRIEWITQKLKAMDDKIENLISRITILEATIKETPEKKLGKLIQETMETITQLKNAASSIDTITETSTTATNFLNKITEYSSKLIEEQRKLSEVIIKIEEERKEIKEKLEKSIEVRAYEKTLDVIKKVLNEIEKIRDNMTEKHGSIITIYDEALKSITAIKDLHYKTLDLLSQLTVKASEITREVKRLTVLEEKIRKNYEEKILEIEKKEKQLNLWSNDLILSQEEIEKKEIALKIKEQKLKEKEEKLIEREDKILKLINKLEVKVKEYENLLRTVNSRILYLEQLKIREKELEEEIKKLKKEKEKLREENEKMKLEHEKLKSKIENLKVQAEELKQIISTSRVKIILATPPTTST